jgi:uncharacterized protein (TIGR00255 family)
VTGIGRFGSGGRSGLSGTANRVPEKARCLAPKTSNAYILPDASLSRKAGIAFHTGACGKSFTMILSMTGFASASAEMPGISLAVELRSVNHRYLDVTIKVPDELRSLETVLRERLASAQKRGKVECRVALLRTVGAAGGIAINTERVQQLATAAASVVRAIPGTAPLSAADVLRWPGVIVDATISPEMLAEQVDSLVQHALSEVLEARCTDIETQVARVTPRIPALHAAYMEKLGGRLREAGLEPNDDRLKQELALFATRIDVAEEVARLTTHVAEIRRVLAQGGPVGKRLDFLAQELHREANTLGSKSVDAELSHVSLELKVLIEQMREQVQNLE